MSNLITCVCEKQRDAKAEELYQLRKLTGDDLWRNDLKAFREELDVRWSFSVLSLAVTWDYLLTMYEPVHVKRGLWKFVTVS